MAWAVLALRGWCTLFLLSIFTGPASGRLPGTSSAPASSQTARPVILVHGLFYHGTGITSMVILENNIREVHPGTQITSISLYEGTSSLKSLWDQVPDFVTAMRPIMQNATNGVILICYSQGGIICRGILETMPDHNVHTCIMLSSPLMGQYGDTSFIPVLPKLREDVYKICYSKFGQYISVCNYWNDPHERALYLKYNDYLPVINNETAHMNSQAQEWKQNFLRMKQLVMIGGPDDGVITPWQSSHFGYYDANESIVEMTEQEVYLNDSFGLQTLEKRQGLYTYNIPGVKHLHWHSNQTVFDCCIVKWLV